MFSRFSGIDQWRDSSTSWVGKLPVPGTLSGITFPPLHRGAAADPHSGASPSRKRTVRPSPRWRGTAPSSRLLPIQHCRVQPYDDRLASARAISFRRADVETFLRAASSPADGPENSSSLGWLPINSILGVFGPSVLHTYAQLSDSKGPTSTGRTTAKLLRKA